MMLPSSDSLFFRGFTERKPFPVYIVACIYTLFRIVAEKLVEGLQALCRAVLIWQVFLILLPSSSAAARLPSPVRRSGCFRDDRHDL